MSTTTLSKLVKGRERFLLSVYAILVVQLVVTFALVRSFQNSPKIVEATKRYSLLFGLASIGVVLIMGFRFPPMIKFLLFTILSAIIALFLTAVTSRVSSEIVNQALASTVGIFVALSVFALMLSSFGIHLGWMGVYLFAALIGLIVVSVVFILYNMFNKPTTDEERSSNKGFHKILVVVGMVLFSLFVVYDTNMVLQRNYAGGPIEAAEDFYLTFINLFTRTLYLESN
jgi:FtsH-binding integral membrane protein